MNYYLLKGVDKKYYVEVDGTVTNEHIIMVEKGIVLDDDYKTLPAKLEILESNVFSKVFLTIQEGKYHQVKRMFEFLSMKVIYLKRVSMGPLLLDSTLSPGEYRELSDEEIKSLRNCQ